MKSGFPAMRQITSLRNITQLLLPLFQTIDAYHIPMGSIMEVEVLVCRR